MGLFDIVNSIGNAIKQTIIDPLTDGAKHDAKYKIRQVVQLARQPPPPPPPPPGYKRLRGWGLVKITPPPPPPALHIGDAAAVAKTPATGHAMLTAVSIPTQHTRSRTHPASALTARDAVAAPSFVAKLEHGLAKPEVQIAMVTGGVSGYLGSGVLLGVVGAALPPVAYAAIVD